MSDNRPYEQLTTGEKIAMDFQILAFFTAPIWIPIGVVVLLLILLTDLPALGVCGGGLVVFFAIYAWGLTWNRRRA